MADYTGDIESIAFSEYEAVSLGDSVDAVLFDEFSDGISGYDLYWLFGPPPVPPAALGEVNCFPRVGVDGGRSELAKLLGALISGGQVHHFKLGEGGWVPSAEQSSTVAIGSGSSAVTGTIPGPPVVPGTLLLEAAAASQVNDQISSPYDGTGKLFDLTGSEVGFVEYKTNYFSVNFDAIIPGGQAITATRKHRGQFAPKSEDFANGNGTAVYSGVLTCTPITPGSVQVSDADVQFMSDNGAGILSGPGGSGTIDYDTGAISVTFNNVVQTGWFARATYLAQGVPMSPRASRVDLAAAEDSTLAEWSKDFVPGVDMVFQGAGTGKVRITLTVLSSEADDDGFGYAPFWTEGGLFSENDVLILYFTMPGILKTTNTIQRQIDLVV